jgi:hypothetical protein
MNLRRKVPTTMTNPGQANRIPGNVSTDVTLPSEDFAW